VLAAPLTTLRITSLLLHVHIYHTYTYIDTYMYIHTGIYIYTYIFVQDVDVHLIMQLDKEEDDELAAPLTTQRTMGWLR